MTDCFNSNSDCVVMLSRILPHVILNHNNQTNTTTHHNHYYYKIERVKFGVGLESVCGAHNDIPSPLLVMILKLNKEAPFKKDVFRAPGHQANMKKLIHFLQSGRLVNIDNYSVYTIASVLKKFLRKLPEGVFGAHIESRLFHIIQQSNTDIEHKRNEIHRLLTSLPTVTQHLLVLLFGTFRAISVTSDRFHTGMTSEAIGVSVAPSFFQSCVQDGTKFAKMEDVSRFKAQISIATTIMKFLIDNFGVWNLFGRDNYEYYARISGRVLRVEQNWIFALKYPLNAFEYNSPLLSDECQSTPALSSTSVSACVSNAQQCMQTMEDDTCYARLSMSLEDNTGQLFGNQRSVGQQQLQQCSPHSQPSMVSVLLHHHHHTHQHHHQQQGTVSSQSSPPSASSVVLESSPLLDDLRSCNRYAESTKSLTFLPLVHARQTQRMKTRSEWFLNPNPNPIDSIHSSDINSHEIDVNNSSMNTQTSDHSMIIRRNSSKEKRITNRSNKRQDKENGNHNNNTSLSSSSSSSSLMSALQIKQQMNTTNTTQTYKPRI